MTKGGAGNSEVEQTVEERIWRIRVGSRAYRYLSDSCD